MREKVDQAPHEVLSISFLSPSERYPEAPALVASRCTDRIPFGVAAHLALADQKVLVTGGAGYIGSVLVPRLCESGASVTVFDALWFDRESPEESRELRFVRGDIRDEEAIDRVLEERFDAVIHLAAISNDPCSDLDEAATIAVNDHAVEHLMKRAKAQGVRRFLYASSASVYGVREEPDVTEDLELRPITIYAKCKARGEQVLNGLVDENFVGCSVRAATVCGYSPRLRLDLTVNILTEHAVRKGKIRVFGGEQMRPNVHILDLCRFYEMLLSAETTKIRGKAFNVSHQNATVRDIAEKVREAANASAAIEVEPSNDPRSYHLCADRARDELGFTTQLGISEASREVADALANGRVPDPDALRYRNVRWMLENKTVWSGL